MRLLTLRITKASGVTTPQNNFKLWLDGTLKLDLTPAEVGSGVTKTVACYRDGKFFSFPNCLHTLKDGFTASPAVYDTMNSFGLARKWLSYIPHADAAEYNVEVLGAALN